MQNILIVDDHVLFREGLASVFRAQKDFNVLGEAGSVREAILVARKLQPDIILMDFSLPDGTGLDATKEILSSLPDTKIIFLTMHEGDDRLFAAIRSGAKGYLLKNLPVSRLLEELRGLERGEAPLSPTMTARVLDEFSRQGASRTPDSAAYELLTDREKEVLQEITTGDTNREIARRLFISENTVKNHVHSILEKLNLSNRREAIKFVRKYRLG
jgi:DNA-binding NarL/FixJ family response regulator